MSATFPWGFLSSLDGVPERKKSAWGEREEGMPLYPSRVVQHSTLTPQCQQGFCFFREC